MRALVCVIAAVIGLAAQPALAQADRSAAAFWKSVQATCDATAAKPASELGQRIAQIAIDEFTHFDGHQVDFGELAARLKAYRDDEAAALEQYRAHLVTESA